MNSMELGLRLVCLALVSLAAGCAPGVAPGTEKTVAPEASAGSMSTAPAAPTPTLKTPAAGPRYGGTLTAWDAIEPEHLDIHQANSGGTLWPMASVYNGLAQHNPLPPHNIIPELAQSWEVSPDGKSYTFTLSPGIKWHDGQTFTGEDVKFSLDRMRNPPKGVISPRQAIYAAIDTVEPVGSEQVKITLKHASPSFLPSMAVGWSVMMPRHIIQTRGDAKNVAVGTGPFRFREFIAGSYVAVEKNKDYFVKGRPYLDGIRWYILKDQGTQFAALRTKRVLMTGYGSRGLDPSELEIIRKEMPAVKIYDYPGGGAGQAVTFNLTKPPFSDVKTRRAAVMALDQGEIIDVALRGAGLRVGPLGPPGEWTLPENELFGLPGIRKPNPSDIAEAKKLLAEAGYSEGLKTSYPYRAGPRFEDTAVVVKRQLARIGIDITLQRLEAAVFQEVQRNRNWDLIQTSHTATINEPDGLLIWYIGGSPNNFSGFNDNVFDDLYSRQSRAAKPEDRRQILSQLERRLAEQVPMFRLFDWKLYFAHWPELKGFAGVGVTAMNNNRWAHVSLSQ